MELETALKRMRGGNCLLFLGAGYSAGAKNLRATSMKTGRQFAAALAVKTNLPKDTNLADAAEVFRDSFGDDALVIELLHEFTVSEPSEHQIRIAALPWKTVYTTNYDDVFERAAASDHKLIQSVTPAMVCLDIPPGVTPCIHLNGAVQGLTKNMLNGELKLTDSSYISGRITDLAWSTRFRQDLAVAHAIFYVGYSTYDMDIARILFESEDLKDKSFFVCGSKQDKITTLRISKFGYSTGLTASEFAAEAWLPKYELQQNNPPLAHSIRTFSPGPILKPMSDQAVYDLFLLGSVSAPLVADTLFGAGTYCVQRDQAKRIVAALKKHPATIVVHSALGNGKTMLLEMVKNLASSEGFTAFQLEQHGTTLHEELETALGQQGRLLCIVDNFATWLGAIEFIGLHKGSNLSIILAGRTVTFEAFEARLARFLQVPGFLEFNSDRLSDADIARVQTQIDHFGFWGEQANLSDKDKRDFLKKHCRGEWHAILLTIFKAPQIARRLEEITRGIQAETRFRHIFTAILVLAIIDHPAETNILVDLCGELTLSSDFRRSESVREFVDFTNGRVKLRSSVAGAFILREVAETSVTLESLKLICRNADQAARTSDEHKAILESLMRFANAQNFFRANDRYEAVLNFYEDVRTLNFCARNPLFWLQFAMAAMSADQYGRARKYFQSAYSYAGEIKFNTYQIDNHFAKLVLLDSIRRNDATDVMKDFRQARKLILEQVTREERPHPYRVAAVMADWYESYEHRLGVPDKNEVARAASFVVARAARLPEYVQTHREVRACVRRLQPIAVNAV